MSHLRTSGYADLTIGILTFVDRRRPDSLLGYADLTIGILTFALSLSLGCKRQPESMREESPPVSVRTITIESQTVPETYEVVGTVRPKVAATVAAKLTATIQSIAVKPGDTVTAGNPLAQLDDREARAEFERAKSDYERYKSLLEKAVITQSEFDAVEERFRLAKTALSHTAITAPFDGIVAEKLCDVGDLATPGKPLFVVEQPTEFRLEAYVPERFADLVQVGTKVGVTIEAIGEETEGMVGEVVPATDPATRSFLVKIDLNPNKALKSGMFGRARFTVGERAAIFVPQSAVRQRGQLTFVFVAQENRAQLRLVKTGKPRGEQIEILSGLNSGNRVIVGQEGQLQDGQPIRL